MKNDITPEMLAKLIAELSPTIKPAAAAHVGHAQPSQLMKNLLGNLPSETPTEIAKLKSMLSALSSNIGRGTGSFFDAAGQPVADYWQAAIWAIAGLGWSCGKDLARDWSKGCPEKYDDAGFEKAWNDYKPHHPNPVGIGSLYKRAMQAGWESQVGSRQIGEVFSSESVNDCVFDSDAGNVVVPLVPPQKRNYVFADQITSGTLTVLGGSGGVSKTMLIMQASVASAVGGSLGNIAVAEGSSLLFLGEEDEAERDRRLGGICAHMKVDLDVVGRRIKCFGAAGIDIRLTRKADSNASATTFGDEVIRIAKAHEIQAGIALKLIVFDHARLVLGGDPNNAEDVTQLTRVLTRIARETKAAVILLAHSPKSVIGKEGDEMNAADIAGSSAFVDNSRAGYMMWTMREKEAKSHHVPLSERGNYVRLQNVKANYARSGGGFWFKRIFLPDWEVAILEQVPLYSSELFATTGTSALRDRILMEVRKKPGGITERQLRDKSGKNGVLKESDNRVRREVDAMVEDGFLDRRAPTPEERKRHKLPKQIGQVLVAVVA